MIIIIISINASSEFQNISAQPDEIKILKDIREVENEIILVFKLINTSNDLQVVKGIISEANNIIDIITETKMDLITGDLYSASSKISSAKSLSKIIIVRAKDLNTQSRINIQILNRKQDVATGSYILLCVIIGIIMWKYIERKHISDILSKKPEISTNEA